jgi:hypothetical protein
MSSILGIVNTSIFSRKYTYQNTHIVLTSIFETYTLYIIIVKSNFLKILSYLNNMKQIDCKEIKSFEQKLLESNVINKPLPIDCKWYKSLLYLDRKNVTMIAEQPEQCHLKEYFRINSISLFIMSKCFSDEVLRPDDETTMTQSKISNQALAANDKNQKGLIVFDSQNKYEFKIEPEINQILVEGDTFELVCRLKKIDSENAKKLPINLSNQRSNNFFNTHIKWFINSSQILATASLDLESTRVQFTENRVRLRNHALLYESRITISKTDAAQHSGKYYCSNELNNNKIVNSSSVDIKILNKNEMKPSDKLSKVSINKLKETERKIVKTYCPEILTQTYKGKTYLSAFENKERFYFKKPSEKGPIKSRLITFHDRICLY